MAIGLPIHNDPNSKVFGIVGQKSESDNGKVYIKTNNDTLNVGWQDTTVVPTTTTTTTTSGPTTTTTSGPTTTTTTTTTTNLLRKINITPAVLGKSVWDLDIDGPLLLSAGLGIYNWEISQYSSPVIINYDINGGCGGNGGYDDYDGGSGTTGARELGSFLLTEAWIIYPGECGGNGGDKVSGIGGGEGGTGFYSGGNGGNAGNMGVSGGGGGGGGASSIIRKSNQVSPVLNVDIFVAGGGGGGGGAGNLSAGKNAVFSPIGLPILSNGSAGVSNPNDGGGGGGGGACGGIGGDVDIGDKGAYAGTNGGGSGKSLYHNQGYITLY